MEFEEKVTYFDPSETEEFKVVPVGEHNATVKNFELKREWSNNDNQVADIYEATYTLADGSKQEVRSKGFFLWKKPGKDDSFVGNPAGNKRINIFLEAIGYPLNTVKIKNSKGEEQEVNAIPELLDNQHIVDQPVKITVIHEEYKGKTYAKEVKVEPWTNAPTKTEKDDEDLPF
tara:strand:+ start:1731 stop:2252 length:522 start_codon:yes stop_codon:yes gene_type:complete